MKTALSHLYQLADERKAAKHPTLPAHARVKAKYSDRSANDLTRCIVDYLTLLGHFATRLQSTGTYQVSNGVAFLTCSPWSMAALFMSKLR